jgi:hypothetical protein
MNKAKEETRQNRTPDLRDSGAFRFTVSYSNTRIVWISSIRCNDLPKWETFPVRIS